MGEPRHISAVLEDWAEHVSEQRSRALEVANEARIKRAGLRRRLRELGPAAGARYAARVLLEPHDFYRGMDVGDLWLMVPRVGKPTARSVLARHRISPWRQVGELTDRERQALADELVYLAEHGRRRRPRLL